jgi:hypothetical protein
MSGNQQMYMTDSVKKVEISKFIIFQASFAGHGILNKDPIVWLKEI